MSAAGPRTALYADRFPEHRANSFFRQAQGLTVSSLGLGSYLGEMDAVADEGYRQAVLAAVRGGINFIDTSLNYRHQASERNIGEALASLIENGEVAREEVVVCTKAGYLVPGALPTSGVTRADIVGNMHSMAPAFLRDQLERSRANLRLETIDVFYLHNPETQLQYVPPDEFYRRIRSAAEFLEEQVAAGKIRFYGAATWNGFRQRPEFGGLALEKFVEIASELAGASHHFRFIQLPFNLAMVDGLPALLAARHFGVTAIASASLLQTKLASGLPDEVAKRLPGASSDALRAIQFTRSSPGVTVALVGMGNPAHVAQNLDIAKIPPADLSAWFPANL